MWSERCDSTKSSALIRFGDTFLETIVALIGGGQNLAKLEAANSLAVKSLISF